MIAVRYDDPTLGSEVQEAAYRRAMDHAKPYLRRLNCNAHPEVDANHIRQDAPPVSEPLICWCGRVHGLREDVQAFVD